MLRYLRQNTATYLLIVPIMKKIEIQDQKNIFLYKKQHFYLPYEKGQI